MSTYICIYIFIYIHMYIGTYKYITYIYVYLYIYTCIYIYIYTHTHVYTYIYVYMYIYIYTYMYIYIYISVCIHNITKYQCMQFPSTACWKAVSVDVFIYGYIFKCMYLCVYTCMYPYIQIYLHTCTYTTGANVRISSLLRVRGPYLATFRCGWKRDISHHAAGYVGCENLNVCIHVCICIYNHVGSYEAENDISLTMQLGT